MLIRKSTGNQRGGTLFSFVLGLFVAGAFIYSIYYFNEADQKHRIKIRSARREKPNSQKNSDYGRDFHSGSEPGRFQLRKFPSEEERIAAQRSSRTADSQQNEREPQQRTARPPEKKQPEDHIISARKMETVFIRDYYMRLHDRPGSYYVRVEMRSYRQEKWKIGGDDWETIKSKTKAITTAGKQCKCEYLWPLLDGEDNSFIIKMIFVVPNGASVTSIDLDGEKWPITVTSKK